MVGLLIFYLWPMARTLYMSLTTTGVFGGATFSGLHNYAELMTDPQVFGALGNTAIYTVLVLCGIPVSIIIAATLDRPRLRGAGVYRVLFLLPVVTLPAATALIWRLVFNSDFGPINSFLDSVGIKGPSWLTDSRTILISLAVVGIWSSIGTQIIIFASGLQSIPKALYEAAELDAATWTQQFLRITLPLLSPTIFLVTVLSIIGSMQMFDLAFLMVPPTNPAYSSAQTMVYVFYEYGFVQGQRGYAAAIAVVLFAVILLFTAIQFRLQRRWVFYG